MSWKRANPEKRLMPLIKIIPDSINHELWVDIGSGDGIFSRMLSKNDNDRTVIRTDITNYANYSNLGVKSFLQTPPYRINSFDGILCSQVLHYIPSIDQSQTLQYLSLCINPGGFLVIIEYRINQGYSWIPYPIDLTELVSDIENKLPLRKIKIKEIPDGNRPKYSVVFQKFK